MDSDGSFCRKTVLVFDFCGTNKDTKRFSFLFLRDGFGKSPQRLIPGIALHTKRSRTPRAVQFDFCFKITLGLSTYSPSVVFNWIINRCMCPSTAVYKIKVCFLCSFFSFTPQFEQRAHRYNNREAFGTLSGVFRELRLSLYANALES